MNSSINTLTQLHIFRRLIRYLLPEYERAEEFKEGLREVDEKQCKKLDLLEKLEEDDE